MYSEEKKKRRELEREIEGLKKKLQSQEEPSKDFLESDLPMVRKLLQK